MGMFVLAALGAFAGILLSDLASAPTPDLFAVVMGLVGALVGLVLTPFFTTRPVNAARAFLADVDVRTLLTGLAGLITGLIVSILIAIPLATLPSPFPQVLTIAATIVCSYLGITVFNAQQDEFHRMFSSVFSRTGEPTVKRVSGEQVVLMDTSVIIDGRIGDIARAGFIPGTLLIPRFILNELQYIADSSDSLRRQRGRRGLEVLTELQKNEQVPVRITDMDVEGDPPVDDKLVLLAKQLDCPVLTNDYNLNRVADIQGVLVLNVNDLANAVKTVFLPGENLLIAILQEGKEYGQGVGYLDDGTMIVVENGSRYIGEEIPTIVTKVLQTSAGRMIFSRPSLEVSQGRSS